MARRDVVARAYKVKAYDSNEALIADPEIDIVANFTSVESHYEVTRQALEAGKHVYSEKPLAMTMDQARELFALAETEGRAALMRAVQRHERHGPDDVEGGARRGDRRRAHRLRGIRRQRRFHLMHPETWRSPTGAPWPYRHEYEVGCTFEHVGYHLTWLCAMFGPVRSVTAFSKKVIPDKTDLPLDPPDTPDFSVACLDFASGVVARVTCSIGVPLDHRMRIVGYARDADRRHLPALSVPRSISSASTS